MDHMVKTVFSLAGLGLNVVGVLLLSSATLVRAAADPRVRDPRWRPGRLLTRILVWLARRLAPPPGAPGKLTEITAGFWGLILVCLGFLLQSAAPLAILLGLSR